MFLPCFNISPHPYPQLAQGITDSNSYFWVNNWKENWITAVSQKFSIEALQWTRQKHSTLRTSGFHHTLDSLAPNIISKWHFWLRKSESHRLLEGEKLSLYAWPILLLSTGICCWPLLEMNCWVFGSTQFVILVASISVIIHRCSLGVLVY